MLKSIHYIIMALGVCLALVSGYFCYQSFSFSLGIISGISILVVIGAIITIVRNSKVIHRLSILLSFFLVVLAWFADSLCWFTFIFGLFAVFAFLFTLRLMPTVKNFILHAQDGATLMEVKKLEFKDGDLIIKGKMMGTMPTVAQMHPEEVWKALSMMSLNVLLGFPAYLFKAWKTKGVSSKQTNTPKYGY